MKEHPTGGWQAPPDARSKGRTVGKYELSELIGAGAMGTVFRARDPDLHRDVAIKLMSPTFARDAGPRGRFHREARAAGSLQHANIITVYGFGEADGELYIAMELVDGRDLSTVIRNREQLSLAAKIDIVLQVLSALSYAHGKGITHRDIKPGNIRITSQGMVKLMDFGVAYLAESDLTNSGLVLGTPNYIAPEQLKGSEPTPSGDLFSIGSVFYELLTYEKPFTGDTPHAVMYNVASDEPVSLHALAASVPGTIRQVLARAMQKQPGHRYRTAGEMAQELSAARAQLTTEEADATVVVPARRRRNRARRTSPRHLAVLGVATLTTIWVVAARGTPLPVSNDFPALTPGVTVSGATIASSPDSVGGASEPDTLLISVRDAALAQRIQAQARGVPAPLLQAGDTEAAVADSLASTGRYTQAILALSSASAKWAGAIAEHNRQPAPSAQRPSSPSRNTTPPKPAATTRPRRTPQSSPGSRITSQAAQAADHRRAIEQVVAYLATALQSRNIGRLLSAYPNLAENERRMWERFFESTEDLTMNLELVDLTIQGDAAAGTVRGTYTYATPKGVKQEPLEFPATFGRTNGEWSINHLGRTATTS